MLKRKLACLRFPEMCILLAEDEFLIRGMAREFLEDAGHEVVTAEHGQEAVDHINHFPGRFVCLVTDYHMPYVHGGQVIEHLRGIYPRMPAILASAFPHVTTSEWRDHHWVHLLVKPYSMVGMVELVESLLH